MPASSTGPGASPAGDAARRARRYPAAYKLRVLTEYHTLDRAGKRALLARERLRASQLSQWRAQACAGALDALSGEPGGQPARTIHISDAMWADLAADGASLDPPFSPERLVRALCSWRTGRDTRLPGQPAPPAPDRAAVERILAGSAEPDGTIPAGAITAIAGALAGLLAAARREQRRKDLRDLTKTELTRMCARGVRDPDGQRVVIEIPRTGRSWTRDKIISAILSVEHPGESRA